MPLLSKEEYLASLPPPDHRVFIQGRRRESVPENRVSSPAYPVAGETTARGVAPVYPVLLE